MPKEVGYWVNLGWAKSRPFLSLGQGVHAERGWYTNLVNSDDPFGGVYEQGRSFHRYKTQGWFLWSWGGVQSLMPLHNVTASVLLTSMFSCKGGNWGWLSEGSFPFRLIS
ncbi:hypothetical protein IFM89_025337 [Coptis chinensis]|uniref:Uncharacterized protein n=1 Tax=Coptis chinensis TaxID=261450 RepID=A0A835I3D4_9MAGN|nr:hypothetical protein IFM89_025337 [Coptis chinensis]